MFFSWACLVIWVSEPKSLCNQVCVLFLFQLSHFYHQNEAVERNGEPLKTFKKKEKSCDIVLLWQNLVLPLASVWTKPNETENQSRENHVENWWKSACLVVLHLVGPEVDRGWSLHLGQKLFIPTPLCYSRVVYDVQNKMWNCLDRTLSG